VLPGAAYTEKTATYVNTEGRAQRALQAVPPPGDAKEDWKILRALSAALGHTLPFDTLEAVQVALAKASPVFAALDDIVPAAWQPSADDVEGELDAAPFTPAVTNVYMTDPISRASRVMAECTQTILNPETAKAA
jgi:NADH-quinone oxidoreductase subunit G